jgi:hypothetical protein
MQEIIDELTRYFTLKEYQIEAIALLTEARDLIPNGAVKRRVNTWLGNSTPHASTELLQEVLAELLKAQKEGTP